MVFLEVDAFMAINVFKNTIDVPSYHLITVRGQRLMLISTVNNGIEDYKGTKQRVAKLYLSVTFKVQ